MSGDEDRFRAIFDACAARVHAYARRHCDAATAQDVVADTMLVAWRRLAVVPDEPLPWLLVVARNTIANRRRGERRHDALLDAAATLARVAGPPTQPDESVAERDALLRGLATLTESEREALLLVAWDGLSNADAATVAGCSKRAFEVRLSRARARLERTLAAPEPVGGP
ncbi:MAG: RNA polymerase sigma factor [Jatrophihabitans sp.]|uniref:RNA polymerase sigma factor n=1 Tax=Jatrophihabitans sp. TaxID=1932789 RepID=UPI003F7D87E5